PAAPQSKKKKTISTEIPIIIEEDVELNLDEPVVALRPPEAMPMVAPRAAASATPVFVDRETSQPIVTIERFPEAELQPDLQAEVGAELAQVLGPVLDSGGPSPAAKANEADFLDVSVELDLDEPSDAGRPITGTRIPSVEALLPSTRTAKPSEPADDA